MALNIEIVTPTQTAFSGEALEVRAPGFLGEFGVLPEHTLFLSVVKAGVVTITTSAGETRYVVGRGFAEAGPDRLSVLTEICEEGSTVDKAAAKTLLESSEKTMATADPNGGDFAVAEHQAEIARARLAV
jgi:F-type H+-transporting ATPase subunit epsilon